MQQNKYISNPSSFIKIASKLTLKLGEIHEVCGPSRIRFPIIVGSETDGLIVWIRHNWSNTFLNPDGLWHWISPERILFINASNTNDLLSCMEEVLRSGIAPLVIAELAAIPKTTPMRRLSLAMRAGQEFNKNLTTIGIILTPNNGGATNIGSRWHISSLPCWKKEKNSSYTFTHGKWCLERLFSKTAPQKKWVLEACEVNSDKPSPKLILKPFYK